MSDETLQDLNYFCEEIQGKGLAIDDYNDWITKYGFPLASLGEDGRELFHRISSTSHKYDFDDCNDKFDDLIKTSNGKVNLETFFYHCIHVLGIDPPKKSAGSFKYSDWGPKSNGEQKTPKSDYRPKVYTLRDIYEAPPESFLWHFIVKGEVNALVAPSEIGKSTFGISLMLAIVKGDTSFLDRPLETDKNRVLYCATESSVSNMKSTLIPMIGGDEAFKEAIDQDEYAIRMIDETRNINLAIEDAISEMPVDLVIIDTWGDFVMGDYKNERTREALSTLKAVCQRHGATLLIIHHTNKVSTTIPIPDKSSVKGASDFEQVARSLMFLSPLGDSERWLSCIKSNSIPKEKKDISIGLTFDPETKQLTASGDTISREALCAQTRDFYTESAGRKAKEIDWRTLLKSALTSGELVKRLTEDNFMSESNARARMRKATEDGLIVKDGKFYRFAQ